MAVSIRKTYDLKQVKVTTSILWLLNKAETRNVFFSSMDIYLDKESLQLHSLIIRGLVCGELYSAAISNLFPSRAPSRLRDLESVLKFLTSYVREQEHNELEEIRLILDKYDHENGYVRKLANQYPFDLSEHVQLIDVLMALYIQACDMQTLIPNIVGKLCNYRPNSNSAKVLLYIWLNAVACLSLTKQNIYDMKEVMRHIIMQMENENSQMKSFLDSIKFSDKLALIIVFEKDIIEFDEKFVFDYSSEGVTSRENIKQNFMSLLSVMRKNKFPKILEDFKELMLILNSNHMTLSDNMMVNIDVFLVELVNSIEDICNHANRTFRTHNSAKEKSNISILTSLKPNTKMESSFNSTTIKKPLLNSVSQYSGLSAFGTYSGRKQQREWNDRENQETMLNWNSVKDTSGDAVTIGKSLLQHAKKYSLTSANIDRTDMTLSDGILKAKYLSKTPTGDEIANKTSWLNQNKKGELMGMRSRQKSLDWNGMDIYDSRRNVRPNETRLRLNLKRKEIERSRQKLIEQRKRERQLLSDKVFCDVVTTRSDLTGAESEPELLLESLKGSERNNVLSSRFENSETPKQSQHQQTVRVSDVKRKASAAAGNKKDGANEKSGALTRSRSQELGKDQMNSISASIDQLKDEISRLSSQQARLSARLEDDKQPQEQQEQKEQNEQNEQKEQKQSPSQFQSQPQLQLQQPLYYSPFLTNYSGITSTHLPLDELKEAYLYSKQHTREKSHSQPSNSNILSPVQPQVELKLQSQLQSELKSKPIVEKDLPSQLNTDEEKCKSIDVTNGDENLEGTNDSKKDNSADMFFISMNDDKKPGKKTTKKPVLTEKRMSPNQPKSNIENNSQIKNDEESPIIEKPVAFVINIDNNNESTKSGDGVDVSKLSSLAKKREQERKEKLEKVQMNKRTESEKRWKEEQDKERAKMEKKMKREAIFEAYKKRKEEQMANGSVTNESNSHVSRKDNRASKRNIRVLSATPILKEDPESVDDGNHSFKSSNSNLRGLEKTVTHIPGMKLFVEPKIKSNKGVILNAIRYCCLAGKVNEALKIQSIEDLEKSSFSHVMILMRNGCKFRGLYGFEPDGEMLVKFSGIGPKKITAKMVDKFFKYNSGAKKFTEIMSTHHLSTVVDGLMIFSVLWKSNNLISSPVGQMNSETSSQPDNSSL